MLTNRSQAGQQLAQKLLSYSSDSHGLVLALPRGGVPIAVEIAQALNLPLEVYLVRKIGVPHHPELAMGAIAWGGDPVVNPEIIRQYAITAPEFERSLALEKQELQRRYHLYQGDRPFPDLCDRAIILVDDGVATGATLQAALQTLQAKQPQSITIAVPVIAPEIYRRLSPQVTHLVSLIQPEHLNSISQWYEDFHQLSDQEVGDYLAQATH